MKRAILTRYAMVILINQLFDFSEVNLQSLPALKLLNPVLKPFSQLLLNDPSINEDTLHQHDYSWTNKKYLSRTSSL